MIKTPFNIPYDQLPHTNAAQMSALQSILTQAQTGDGLVNLTNLCAVFGKTASAFLSLPATIHLMKHPGAHPEFPEGYVRSMTIGGTRWVHYTLAIQCARLLCSEFKVHHSLQCITPSEGSTELQMLTNALATMRQAMTEAAAREEVHSVCKQYGTQRRVSAIF